MSRKTDLKRYRKLVLAIRINHAAYGRIREELGIAFDSIGDTATPVCLLVTGETRTGKSSVVKEMLDQFTGVETGRDDVQTIVYAVAPPKATLRSLLEAMLFGLGDPHWTRGTESNLTQRLYTQLKEVNCRMIVLDEFQHLCDKGQDKRLKMVSDWLKVLVESKQWGLVAVGLPESASIVHTHRQLASRFQPQLKMPLFDWQDCESRRQFRGILKGFRLGLAPFELPLLESDEVAFRMYLATAGRVGLIAKLLDRAVGDAVRAGRLKIPLEALARAYANEIWAAPMFPIKGGPFLAPREQMLGANVRQAVLTAAALEAYADGSGKVTVYGDSSSTGTGAGNDAPQGTAGRKRKPERGPRSTTTAGTQGRRRGPRKRAKRERRAMP